MATSTITSYTSTHFASASYPAAVASLGPIRVKVKQLPADALQPPCTKKVRHGRNALIKNNRKRKCDIAPVQHQQGTNITDHDLPASKKANIFSIKLVKSSSTSSASGHPTAACAPAAASHELKNIPGVYGAYSVNHQTVQQAYNCKEQNQLVPSKNTICIKLKSTSSTLSIVCPSLSSHDPVQLLLNNSGASDQFGNQHIVLTSEQAQDVRSLYAYYADEDHPQKISCCERLWKAALDRLDSELKRRRQQEVLLASGATLARLQLPPKRKSIVIPLPNYAPSASREKTLLRNL
ncbi:hypothetical protein L7F22_045525 [Adiantum nelumboides]|nr:hypothetical protein [Adiantum nelumboides]